MGSSPGDPTPTQLYVSGVVGNTTDFGENNYEDFFKSMYNTKHN